MNFFVMTVLFRRVSSPVLSWKQSEPQGVFFDAKAEDKSTPFDTILASMRNPFCEHPDFCGIALGFESSDSRKRRG